MPVLVVVLPNKQMVTAVHLMNNVLMATAINNLLNAVEVRSAALVLEMATVTVVCAHLRTSAALLTRLMVLLVQMLRNALPTIVTVETNVVLPYRIQRLAAVPEIARVVFAVLVASVARVEPGQVVIQIRNVPTAYAGLTPYYLAVAASSEMAVRAQGTLIARVFATLKDHAGSSLLVNLV